jgi:hypothetical protein
MPMLARSALAALVGIAALTPATSEAQGNPQPIYNEFTFNYAGIAQPACISGNVLGQYEATASCARLGVSATTFASTVGGELRARATLTATGPVETSPGGGLGYLQSANAYTFAYFNETFTFGAVVPASVVFHYALTGDPSLTLSNYTAGITQGILQSTVSITNGQGGSILLREEVYKSTSELPGDDDRFFSERVGSTTTFLRGTPVVRVTTAISARATLLTYRGRSATGALDADYSHTGRIAYIQAFDESGADISGSVAVSTASGVTYTFGAPVSTVPEPGTWALLGTGLLGIGGVTARRRRAT